MGNKKSLIILVLVIALLMLSACESGIAKRTSGFSEQELTTAINTLNAISERAVTAGACSWGLDSMENKVAVWIDPFTDDQIDIFKELLSEASIDQAMISIKQAVTQEMAEQREAAIASAMQSTDDRIVHVGGVVVNSTGIAFSLENRTDMDFNYGDPWDMAYFTNGRWIPVQHLPGKGGGVWNDILHTLPGGETRQFEVTWEWRFGECAPGRYTYILGGYFGDYTPDYDVVYVTVEFTIT